MPKITLPGVTLDDVPKSTIAIVALLFALSAVFLGYWTKVRQPELELVSAKEATEAVQLEVEEYGKHIGEKPVSEFTLSESPLLQTKLYKDRCILLISETPDGVRSKLIRDIARDSHPAPKKTVSQFDLSVILSAAGQCLFPHPGVPTLRYGPKDGCWVPVWRIFKDGCTYVQMLDSCHGIWDSNIKWTACFH